MKRAFFTIALVAGLLTSIAPLAYAQTLTVQEEYLMGYQRSLFKLWIDADKNGCDTRAEVLIQEAIIKPKIGKNCSLTGGTWQSPYDEVRTSQASDLDIDHVVPLAEAWRSGAWAWTPAQRQAYANEIADERVLVAVSLGQNRSKGDKDPASWLPPKGVCTYIENWIAIKVKYSLTIDAKELSTLNQYVTPCKARTTASGATPIAVATWSGVIPTSAPTAATVSAGAFCSVPGARAKSAAGVIYTCKSSATDTRKRWR